MILASVTGTGAVKIGRKKVARIKMVLLRMIGGCGCRIA
jgi:hypothetical protein